MLLNEKVELDLIQNLFLKAESGIKTIMKMSKNLKKKSVTYIKLQGFVEKSDFNTFDIKATVPKINDSVNCFVNCFNF